MNKKNYADAIIKHIERLPPMPQNIVELRKRIADPHVNFASLVPILKNDPALCADLLHIANSAFYGVHHTVETVDEAVRYFGVDHLVDFISVSFSEKVVRGYFKNVKNLNDYFHHSLNVSTAAGILAKVARKDPHEQNVTAVAGLLHDIGRLIILVVTEQSIEEVTGDSYDCIIDIVKNEKAILGIDHCEIGAKICKKWMFPEHLQTAVLRHHTPLEGSLCEAGAFILLAHFVTMENFPISLLIDTYPPDVMKILGLSEHALMEARQIYRGNAV